VENHALLHPLAAPFALRPDRDDIVLLLHGWTGSPSHLRLIADDLVTAGFGVTVPLLPGHGTTIKAMLDVGWRDWLGAAAEAADDVLASGAKLHVGGLSMGGLLAILLATTFEPVSVTTINTPIRTFEWRIRFSALVKGSPRVIDEPEPERAPGFASGYDWGYRETPVGSVADLYLLMRAARNALPHVSAPTLVIQSHADKTVRPASGSIIYDGVGAAVRRMVWLEDSSHMATLDVERHEVAAEMARHLRDAQGLASLEADT
jgi:carboxylesterase